MAKSSQKATVEPFTARAMFRELKGRLEAEATLTGVVRETDDPAVLEIQCRPGCEWLAVHERWVIGFDPLGAAATEDGERALVTLYLQSPETEEGRLFAWSTPRVGGVDLPSVGNARSPTTLATAHESDAARPPRPGQTRCRFDAGTGRWICPD